jgi:hypothetical protein
MSIDEQRFVTSPSATPTYPSLELRVGLRYLDVPQPTTRCNLHSHHHDINDAVQEAHCAHAKLPLQLETT